MMVTVVFPLPILTGQINGQGVSGTLVQVITNDQPVNEFYLKPFQGFDSTRKPEYMRRSVFCRRS